MGAGEVEDCTAVIEAGPSEAEEGAEGGDAGADYGHVGFEGGPDSGVDVIPC